MNNWFSIRCAYTLLHAFFLKITFVIKKYVGLGCNKTITTVFSIPSTKIKSGEKSKKGRKITIKPPGKDRKKLKTPLKTHYYLTYILSKLLLSWSLGLIHFKSDNTMFSHIIVLLQGWVPKPWFFFFLTLVLRNGETVLLHLRCIGWIHSFLDVIRSQKSRPYSFSFSFKLT